MATELIPTERERVRLEYLATFPMQFFTVTLRGGVYSDMLGRGWIERQGTRYRITEAGLALLAAHPEGTR